MMVKIVRCAKPQTAVIIGRKLMMLAVSAIEQAALKWTEMVHVVKLRQAKKLSESDDDRRRNVYNDEFGAFLRACRYA